MNAEREEILDLQAAGNSDPKLVDYWCRDCRDYFRAPHQPDPHAHTTPCPKGHPNNTYEACCDDANKREEDDSD